MGHWGSGCFVSWKSHGAWWRRDGSIWIWCRCSTDRHKNSRWPSKLLRFVLIQRRNSISTILNDVWQKLCIHDSDATAWHWSWVRACISPPCCLVLVSLGPTACHLHHHSCIFSLLSPKKPTRWFCIGYWVKCNRLISISFLSILACLFYNFNMACGIEKGRSWHVTWKISCRGQTDGQKWRNIKLHVTSRSRAALRMSVHVSFLVPLLEKN